MEKENQVIVVLPFHDYESDMKTANMFSMCFMGFCLLPVKSKILVGTTVLLTLAFSEFIKPKNCTLQI